MAYTKQFTPKRSAYSFRNLEVYQKTMECSILITKDISPVLAKLKYEFLENMTNCSMSIPLYIGESHSIRYDNFTEGVGLLDKAMSSSNKMIIYLEQTKGLYGEKVDVGLIEDIITRYADSRSKMFRLGKAWKRYRENDLANPKPKTANFKY
ncbi:MAG: hypothetical protein V1891_02480 [bacterium]